jgi:hypothetical protein
MFVLNAIIV